MALSFFDYLGAINHSKIDIMVDDITEKEYNAFMVNRGLSYFQDTIHMANEMNLNTGLSNRQQFDFLRSLVRKRKRFSKWDKAIKSSDVDIVKEYYDYNDAKAKQVLELLSREQLDNLKARMSRGGRKR